MIENGVLKPSGVVQLRGGSFEAMREANPLLARREIAVETDTGNIKVGNGSTYWNDLPYSGASSHSIQNGQVYMLVHYPNEWLPDIDDVDTLYFSLNEQINPFQFTGLNSEVNS